MVNKFISTILPLLCLCSLNVLAQNDLRSFQVQALDKSLLYRSKIAMPYMFHYNGTYYRDSPKFVRGSITYNGKLYEDVLLNIDACSQEVLVKRTENTAAVVPSRELVSAFRMDAAVFLNLQAMGAEDAPVGFHQVLYDGKSLFLKHITKTHRTDAGDKNGKEIGYQDPGYNSAILDYFAIGTTYWLLRDSSVVQIRKKKDFLCLYDNEQKKQIKAHIKSLNFAVPPSLEVYCTESLRFMEGGGL